MSADRVLVTGGAGFIGSHLVERLVMEGAHVGVVDNLSSGSLSNIAAAAAGGGVRFHEVDIRSRGLAAVYASERPDVVVHLAAQADVRISVANPILDADINILGTLNVLERAREAGVRKVIVASSGGCIYGEPRRLPVDESCRATPLSPYGISKRVLHNYMNFYAKIHGLDHSVLALSNVYGPRQDPRGEAGVIPIFLRSMLEDGEPVIYGDGRQTRDFIYVDDVIESILCNIDSGGGIFNIGTGIETSLIDLWHRCASLTGFSSPPRFAPARAGELNRNAIATRRAREVLGWQPEVELDDGLVRTLSWVRQSSGEPVGADSR